MMALELFKQFIYDRLDATGLLLDRQQAKKWLKRKSRKSGIYSTEVIREHPVSS